MSDASRHAPMDLGFRRERAPVKPRSHGKTPFRARLEVAGIPREMLHGERTDAPSPRRYRP